MRKRIVVFSAIVMLACLTAATANATDLNGKWKGDMKTPNGDSMEINFNFQVTGEKVTGTVANSYGEEQITEGVLKGDAISFVILAGGGQFKLIYKGKVVGEELKFNVTIGDMGEGELTAKRVK
jgi:autotransporter translocation and assembly factor TamB